jgi:hypothetical protein
MGGEGGSGARDTEERQAGSVEDGDRALDPQPQLAGREGGDAGPAGDSQVAPVAERGGGSDPISTSRMIPPPRAVITANTTTPTMSRFSASIAVRAPFRPNTKVPERSSASWRVEAGLDTSVTARRPRGAPPACATSR